MILSEKDILKINELELLLDKTASEKQILSRLKTLRYKNIGNKVFDKLLNYCITTDTLFLAKKNRIDVSLDIFENVGNYSNFMDFFTRKLTKEKKENILNNIKSDMIIPNECYVESFNELKNSEQILRLKKGFNDVVNDLNKYGLNVSEYSYINMKLLLSYYHRVHSPISGVIKNMYPIEGEDNFFGKNSLWILEYETDKYPVYFMLVGESSVQDFNFFIEKNDNVNIFDELGYFNWGSQTLILYNSKDYPEINLIKGKHYFVGDNIF